MLRSTIESWAASNPDDRIRDLHGSQLSDRIHNGDRDIRKIHYL